MARNGNATRCEFGMYKTVMNGMCTRFWNGQMQKWRWKK